VRARCLADPALDLRFWRADIFQAEGHVLAHAHMWIKGVGLEDHREPAIRRANFVDPSTVDPDLSLRDRLEPCYHAKQGRLSAAGGTHEDSELTVLDT
jgi:hypothetical protein